jgi:IS30 family transposase
VSLFVQSGGALRRELTAYLRRGRRMRQPRRVRLRGQSRGQVRDMVMISDRPAEISDRAVPGHWEGDLLLGRRHRDRDAGGANQPLRATGRVA